MTEKTTVYLGPEYRRLKELARERGRPAAELVRAAVAEYVQNHAPRTLPRSLAIGDSRRGNLSESIEDELDGFGEDR